MPKGYANCSLEMSRHRISSHAAGLLTDGETAAQLYFITEGFLKVTETSLCLISYDVEILSNDISTRALAVGKVAAHINSSHADALTGRD